MIGRTWTAVEVKRDWPGKWVYAPNLIAGEIVAAMAPEISTAELSYRVGRLKYPTDSVAAQVNPLDLRTWYVRIRYLNADMKEPASLFTGVIDEDTRALQPAQWLKGQQQIRAYGIPHLLDRNGLDNAWVETSEEVEIKWTPSFNSAGLRGMAIRGNRTRERSAEDDVYLFGRYGGTDFSNIESEWTNRDIAEYLLKRHPQAKLLAEVGIKLKLMGEIEALDNIRAVHDFSGFTLWECLNNLIKPTEGLTFYVTIGESRDDYGTMYLNVVSMAGDPIKVGQYELPGNKNRVQFFMPSNWPHTHMVGQIPIKRTTAGMYDTIVARGQRVKVVGTFCYDHDTLEKGWTTTLQTSYETAGSGDSVDRDEVRARDKYAGVWTRHVVPQFWDWKLGIPKNGTTSTGDEMKSAAPYVREDGKVFFGDPEYGDGPATDFEKEFLRDTPFRENFDYSTAPPTTTGTADEEQRYKPLLVAYYDQHTGPNHSATAKWYLVDRLSEGIEDLRSMHVTPGDGTMGFVVTASPRHYLALNHMAPVPTETEPELDYELLLVTAMVESDSRIEVTWHREGKPKRKKRPRKPDGREFERKLVIEVAEAEYWYVAPGTVVDIADDGKLVHVASGNNYLRDDTPRLEAIVAFAAAWFGQERHAVQIPIARLGLFVQLGSYLDKIAMVRDTQPIGTVITARRSNCRSRETVIETGYVAFDAVRFAANQRPGKKFAGRGVVKKSR